MSKRHFLDFEQPVAELDELVDALGLRGHRHQTAVGALRPGRTTQS